MARTILYVPMLHQRIDTGFSEDCTAIGARPDPETAAYADRLFAEIDLYALRYWGQIGPKLEVRRIDNIYPEALYSDFEDDRRDFERVRKGGSRAADFVLSMHEKGVPVVPIEDRGLIKEATTLRMTATFITSHESMKEEIEENIRARDRFIARRIDEDLKDGETGVLLLGASHDPLLRSSIDVKYVYDPKLMLMEMQTIILCSQ